jgi:hypothetical protein
MKDKSTVSNLLLEVTAASNNEELYSHGTPEITSFAPILFLKSFALMK